MSDFEFCGFQGVKSMIAGRNQEQWNIYLKERSEEAFTQVVTDHVDLVYGTALRSLAGDVHLAKDATQSVFIDLAGKKPKLESDAALAGWLYRHTQFTASKMVRTEQRRRQREQKFGHMKPSLDSGSDDQLELVSPHLDQCLQELGDSDRETLLLRFFQKKPLKRVGEELGISADAAQKRVRRALDKLKGLLERRGVALTVTSLATVLTSQSAVAAPLGLAAQIASTSLLASATQTGWVAALTQMNQHFIGMKTSYIVTGAATMMVAVPLVYQFQSMQALKEEQEALREEITAMDGVSEDYTAWQMAQNELARFEQLRDELGDKGRIAEEVDALKADDAEDKLRKMAELNDAKAKLENAQLEKEEVEKQIQFKNHQVKVVNTLKHLGLAAHIFASEHAEQFPSSFDEMEEQLSGLEEQFKDTPLEGFEYFRHERPVVFSGSDRKEPTMILFREVEPRFDGETYHRAYTFYDGSVQIKQSETPDFSEFEKLHTATPENLPESIQAE